MKHELLNLIVCPDCKQQLEMKSFKEERGETHEGVLICRCGQFFPIVNSIPRMMVGEMRSTLHKDFPEFFLSYKNSLPAEKFSAMQTKEGRKKQETSKSFAYEWQKFSGMLPEWKKNFSFYFEPAGNLEYLKDAVVLEVGCGKGRHTYYAAHIAKEVIAVDVGRAVDVALANNQEKKNIHFIQADVYYLPFRDHSFPFIFSIGVLHHLPDPEQCFKRLVNILSPGGGILIYLYHSFSKKTFNYYLLLAVNIFRRITVKLPHNVLYILSYPIAFFSYLLLVLPYKLFFKNFIKQGWPLGLYAEYPFGVLINDTFDRFSAPIENRYSKDQVVAWYERAQLKNISVLGGGGWRAFGKKI